MRFVPVIPPQRVATTRCLCFLLLLILLLVLPAFAAPGGRTHRVAILADKDVQPLPFVPLLETQLTNRTDIELVEREQLAAILKEQSLAALSNAASGANRLTVGKLLNAEVLLILTRRDAQDKGISVVVSETRQGLRLRTTQVPVADTPEATASAVAGELNTALKKLTETIRLIAAVPPLMNKDLTRDRDYLQDSYARLLQELLLNLPGVIVVDTDEAKAIGSETALGGTTITRSLPVYLIGEYRFDVGNAQIPPYVKLVLHQGERELGTRQVDRPTSESAPVFLRKATAELISLVDQQKVSLPDPVLEAQQLAARARQFFLIGMNKQSTELAEASLLLNPNQPQVHRQAMSAYGGYAEEFDKPNKEAIRRTEMAIDHMAQYLIKTDISNMSDSLSANLENEMSGAFAGNWFPFQTKEDPEVNQLYESYQVNLRNAYKRVLAAKAQENKLNDRVASIILWRFLNVLSPSTGDNLKQRLELVPLLLTPTVINPYYIECVICVDQEDFIKHPAYTDFLNTLEKKYPDPKVTLLIVRQRNNIKALTEQETRPSKQPTIQPQPPVVTPDNTGLNEVVYTPIVWTCEGKTLSRGEFSLSGILSCGDTVDLVWGFKAYEGMSVYLMRSKGQLSKVATIPGGFNFGQAAFDGKNAWLPIISRSPTVPEVVVIDVASGKTTIVSVKHGLPLFTAAASAALAPGRICLSGLVGSTSMRTFVAILTLDPGGKHRVQIIHEATKQPDLSQDQVKQRLDPELIFSPKFMLAKIGADGHTHVVIGRSLPGASSNPSLLIDINTLHAQVIKADVEGNISRDSVSFVNNEAYWVGRGGVRHLSIDSTDNVPLVNTPEESSKIIYWKGRVHIVARNWWVADQIDAPFRKLNGPVPVNEMKVYLNRLYISNHYGVVLFTNKNQEWTAYQVTFPGLPPKE
ncbi:MAG: hypothetical protein ACYDBB_17220 [Armatimonadota bacterium]